MQTRLITIVARRVVAVSLGASPCTAAGDGSNCCAELVLAEVPGDAQPPKVPWDDALDARWPTTCLRCGGPVPVEGAHRHMSGGSPVFDTGARPQPGDMWLEACNLWVPCYHWDNCTGHHLHVVLPNGMEWDVDSRANNCTMPNDRTHRCWVREGEPPNVTAGKAGHTCQAGAGSILAGSYHGFLRGGVLQSC